MSGDVGELAERMVQAALSARGAHKAAGAAPVFTRDSLMSWCLPLAEAMMRVQDRLTRLGTGSGRLSLPSMSVRTRRIRRLALASVVRRNRTRCCGLTRS